MRLAIIVAAASVALSGCITSKLAKMTPEQQVALINAAADAGCSGQLNFGVHGSTAAGVSLGSAGADFTFSGGCDPAKARTRVIPISELTARDVTAMTATTNAGPFIPQPPVVVRDGIGDVLNPPR